MKRTSQLAALTPDWLRRSPAAPTALAQVTKSRPVITNEPFDPRPAPTGKPPYRLRLADVLPASDMRAIERAGHLRFQCVGDTGGLANPLPQRQVAAAMAAELRGEEPVRFFYHLGDVVYCFGEEEHYGPQFVRPYAQYTAPIFGIPGNHDGDRAPGSAALSLQSFVKHFCAPTPALSNGGAPAGLGRAAAHQPNVYWTLLHDWVTIIGMYTNGAEGGRIADDQLRWLISELSAAPVGITLILALHHPVYSADSIHGSNLALGDLLDQCFAQAERTPDAVLSAHAHNYQRFTRTSKGRQIPYVVAGSGGFPNLHTMAPGVPATPASFDGLPEVVLEVYQDTDFGFMTLTATPEHTQVVYQVVRQGAARMLDTFSITPG